MDEKSNGKRKRKLSDGRDALSGSLETLTEDVIDNGTVRTNLNTKKKKDNKK